jgi:hypothetical protein
MPYHRVNHARYQLVQKCVAFFDCLNNPLFKAIHCYILHSNFRPMLGRTFPEPHVSCLCCGDLDHV